jgi:hypothetical protein
MSDKKEMKYRKRNPDIETETLRIWKADKEEKQELEQFSEGDIKLKLKNSKGEEIETNLCGFNKAYKKDNNSELIFAWKFKHEDRLILFYLKDKEGEDSNKAIEFLKGMGKAIGYEVEDIEEKFKQLINDNGLMKMISKDKEVKK